MKFRLLAVAMFGLSVAVYAADAPAWNPKAAAGYLDARMEWWLKWPTAQRENTACVSCHTGAPYALARPALHTVLRESTPTTTEQSMYAGVIKRVTMWKQVEPAYSDQRNGLPKTSESRGTEAILNALVLAARDGHAGAMTPDTRQAFANLWALQFKVGELKGAWAWLNFHFEPWESTGGAYYGATLAAVALGAAPAGYAASPDIQDQVALLRDYLQRNVESQTLFNRATVLWAGGRLPQLLTAAQREAIVDAIVAAQQSDGGWPLAGLGAWKRVDNTSLDTATDGYATALMTLALKHAGVARGDAAAAKGVAWLTRNQDPATGVWRAVSLNKKRDPASDIGKFMDDAATAYAVLALTR